MANLKERIYKSSPVLIQHALVSIYGFRWKRYRFGGQFNDELRGFLGRENYSASEWEEYSEQQLRALLLLAIQHVPYYQEQWRSLGLTVEKLARFTLADLGSLPMLEKSVARDTPKRLLLDGGPNKHHAIAYTSGSTGTPVTTYWLPVERQKSLALREARECHFAGVSYSLPRATFSGRIVEPNPQSKGPFYRFNWSEKQVYFSAFHLRPETAAAYIYALSRHNIQWMNGYANSIYQLALMVLDQKLQAPQLRAVISTSEKLTDIMRETIERAFSTRVYEQYGCVEDVFYACECKYGRKHISPDAGIIEVVDENFQPVPLGTMGEVVVTGLVRPSQPFIRYRVGDQAVLSSESCPCGRQMPILREIVGRIEDTVYAPDGRRMVRFHGIFANQPHIQEGQIIQEQLDLICVKIVPKPEFGSIDEQEVIERVQQRLTSQMKVIVEVVDHIERTSAGKLRSVVSKLPKEQIDSLNRSAKFHEE